MKTGRPFVRVLLYLACFSVTFLASARTGWTQNYTGMVSFGDSLSDLGNTVATLSAFGEPFVREQTGYNANFYFNGRFSNGPLWSERLNDQLGFGPMLRNNGIDLLTGSNFAWAGSTSGTGNTGFLLPNLRTQVNFYTAQIPTSLFLPDPATTLFTIWSGGNDVINLVDNGTLITPEQVAGNISTAITNLYNAGGRTFLVPNLPPLGFKPNYVFDPVKQAAANGFVDSYNPLLESTLNTLSGNLTGSAIIYLDTAAIFLDAIADPAAYGLTNVTETAYTAFSGSNPPPPYGSVVGNPEQYLFWDNSHATTSVNFLIAQQAYAAIVPEPTACVLLLIGVIVALSFSRKRNPHPIPQ